MYFVALIVKNLTQRPVRTALTVLGLSVAVGSMVALMAVSYNVERSVEAAFDVRRVDLITMQANKPLGIDSDFGEFFVEAVSRFPEVERVSEGVVSNANLQRPNGTVDENGFLVQGWKPENFGFEDLQLLSGRMLTATDARKAMIGSTFARNFNKKVGDALTFVADPDHPYEVVAVFKSSVVFEDGGVLVPFKDGQALSGKRVTGFSIRVRKAAPDSEAEVAAVREKVAALRDPKDPTVKLSAERPDKYVQSVSQLQLIRAVAWIVSAIALAISAISLLNTMTMSVLERTQEIGILRAVGWPRGRVLKMVMGEAALLSGAAALGGTLIAFVGMQALARFPKVNGFIEPQLAPAVLAQGVAVTVLVGLLGGAYPAYRASRLLPTEALRHD